MNDDRLDDIQVVIADIKVRLFAHLEIEEKQNAEIHELLKKHDQTLYGNGHPGLKTQVDRIEQREFDRSKHIAAMWTVIAGILIAIGVQAFKVLIHKP